MSESTDPQAWVLRAEEDYLLCRSALRRKMPLLYDATFHAQQCAEKYLKALLVARGQAFPRTHDLAALHDLCVQLCNRRPRRLARREKTDPENVLSLRHTGFGGSRDVWQLLSARFGAHDQASELSVLQ